MSTALFTNYLTDYRVPLYRLLHEHLGVEVLCYGGGERYMASWFSDLDGQLAAAPFPAGRLSGPAAALRAAGEYELVIAPFAGGAMLPALYAGARARRRRFVLWASVWAQPRSLSHLLALPATRHILAHADAVLAYGEHVRQFVGGVRGRTDDVFVAAQAVEPELFGRPVGAAEITAFRARHKLPSSPLVLYVGRLVADKGVDVLLRAHGGSAGSWTLVLIGEGPLAEGARCLDGVRVLGALPRAELPAAYAAAELTVLASVPSPRFREPWGLVLNEAMLGGRPVVASDGVGAVAGGLVRDGQTGLVVPSADATALRAAIARLLGDESLRQRLGEAGRAAAAELSYGAALEAFGRAIATARGG